MIQPNELRIGNYVHSNIIDDTIQVSIITSEIKADPIPLTEEWLIKFGFKENEFSLVFENGLIGVYEQDNLFWFDTNTDCIEIKHVHQLQNIYFALTGKELQQTNN